MANAKIRTNNGHGAGPGGDRWCPRADAKERVDMRWRAEDRDLEREALDELAQLGQEMQTEFYG